jgi:hypothetical protein
MRVVRTVLTLTVALGLVGRAAAQDDRARQILEKAIKAHGGAERLGKITAGCSETQGKLFKQAGLGGQGEVNFRQKAWFQVPQGQALGSVRAEMTVFDSSNKMATIITVVNCSEKDSKGWIRVGDETRDMDDKALAVAKEELYLAGVHRLVALRDKPFELSFAGEAAMVSRDENGNEVRRPIVGIHVRAPGHRTVDLYFDANSGLLAQTKRVLPDPLAPARQIVEAKTLTDYRPADDVKFARKVTVYRRPADRREWSEGDRFMTTDVERVNFAPQLGEGLFDRPQGPWPGGR